MDDEDARFRARFVASATRKGGSSFRAEEFERAGAHLRRIILRLRHGEGPGRALRARSSPRGGECGAFTGSFVVSRPNTASSPRDSAPPETRDGVSTTTRLCSSRSADRDAPGPDAFSARSRRSPRCAWRAPGIAAVRGPRGCEGGRFDILEKVCYWIRRRHAGNEVHPVRPRRAHRRRAWKLCVRPPSPPLASERGGAGSRDVDGRHPRYPETGPA